MIVFSFESRTCLESKCLIYLPIFFSSSMIFFNEGVYESKAGEGQQESRGFCFGKFVIESL